MSGVWFHLSGAWFHLSDAWSHLSGFSWQLGAASWFYDPLVIYSVPKPNSNINILGRGVVEAYGRNFDTQLQSKWEAVSIEMGTPAQRVRPLWTFGKVTMHGDRYLADEVDIYHLGSRRTLYFYPLFGLYKSVLFRWDGWDSIQDIPLTNNRTPKA